MKKNVNGDASGVVSIADFLSSLKRKSVAPEPKLSVAD